MAITQAMCTSFKSELMQAVHNFKASGGNSFKLALYTSSATMSASTTAYSSGQEASGTNYSAGGSALTNVDPTTSSTTAYTDFADLTFGTATITARGCMIIMIQLLVIHLLQFLISVETKQVQQVVLQYLSQLQTQATLLLE